MLEISKKFTVDDIHKIREYNYEITKNMTVQERRDYYNHYSMEAQKEIEKRRSQKNKIQGSN